MVPLNKFENTDGAPVLSNVDGAPNRTEELRMMVLLKGLRNKDGTLVDSGVQRFSSKDLVIPIMILKV
jgi:hypothetical protein